MARIQYTMRVLRDTLGKEQRDLAMWNQILSRPMPEELSEFDRQVPGMIEKYERQLEDWHSSLHQATKGVSSGEVRIEDLRSAIAILENNP